MHHESSTYLLEFSSNDEPGPEIYRLGIRGLDWMARAKTFFGGLLRRSSTLSTALAHAHDISRSFFFTFVPSLYLQNEGDDGRPAQKIPRWTFGGVLATMKQEMRKKDESLMRQALAQHTSGIPVHQLSPTTKTTAYIITDGCGLPFLST